MKTSTEITHSKQIAIEILKQLGGNKFIAMTGAKNFVYEEQKPGKISFAIGRNPASVKWVRITLNSMDLYDMEFLKEKKQFESYKGKRIETGSDIITVATRIGLYNDMLQSVFTQVTGLNTHL